MALKGTVDDRMAVNVAPLPEHLDEEIRLIDKPRIGVHVSGSGVLLHDFVDVWDSVPES